jgi:predicted RNA binding protein YcfA (HicA-like mRNA interferase family)
LTIYTYVGILRLSVEELIRKVSNRSRERSEVPTTYEELRDRLSEPPLPKSLPIAKVKEVMKEMGYTLKVEGSHHHWRKPGSPRLTAQVHGKKINEWAVRDLAGILKAGGE